MKKKQRILEVTNNMLHLYAYHIGTQQVPEDFHQWCCIAGVAACVQDNVWYEKFKGTKLTPSLYTFLIGPSAIGKGQAMDLIQKYLEQTNINIYAGASSAAKMTEMMSSGGKSDASKKRSKLLLIMEELTMCIGSGPLAFDFVRWMTGLYKKGDSKIRKGTITSANAVIVKHNVNWLAGTTTEWLAESLPKHAIEGGFLGRLITIASDYDLGYRIFEPEYPHDYDEVHEELNSRFRQLTEVHGQFTCTLEAKQHEKQWFMTRPEPTDKRLVPTWIRQHDLALKLAMVFSLCESHDLRITKQHMEAGIDASNAALSAHKEILAAASTSPETEGLIVLETKLRKERVMQRSTLMAFAQSHGMDRTRMDRHLATLHTAKRIKSFTLTTSKGVKLGLAYEYLGGRVSHLRSVSKKKKGA